MGQGCTLSGDCPIQGPIRSLHHKLNRFLAEVTLKDLWEDRLDGEDHLDAYADITGTDCACRATNKTSPGILPEVSPEVSPAPPKKTSPLAEPAGVEIYQGA